MRTRLVLILLASAAIAAEPYRPGLRDAAQGVIGVLSDCHEAQGIAYADASGATVRVTGIAGKIRIEGTLPPFAVYRPGAGWISYPPLADAKKDASLETVWISTSDPVRLIGLKDGATVLGTLYHEQAGTVLQVELLKGERPQDDHDFAWPTLAAQDLVSALLGADARHVRRLLVGRALAEAEDRLAQGRTDEEAMKEWATAETQAAPAVRDVLWTLGQPGACWVRLAQRDGKTSVYHEVLTEKGWRIDDLAAADPRPEAQPAGPQAGAPAPPAEERPALAVKVSLPTDSLQEGDRAVATFEIENQGKSPVIPISIEPEEALEMSGGDLLEALRAGSVEVDAVGGTIETRSPPPQSAVAPATFPSLRHPSFFGPGVVMKHEVVFKAPAGHVYAIHWKVTYTTVEKALDDRVAYASTGQATGTDGTTTTYRRVASAGDVNGDGLIKIDGLADPGVVHVALAVEVKPREFSFAMACQKAGIVPSASTWYEPAQVWALSLNQRTWIVRPDGHMSDLSADYVPLLSSVQLLDEGAIRLAAAPGQKDALASWLDSHAAAKEEGKGGGRVYHVSAKDLPEALLQAESLGFVVTGGGWKKMR